MGTIAGSQILDRAAKTLLDETGVQWAPSELLDYLNAGQNAIVANKPDACVRNLAVQLTASETKQTIPTDGYQFLDVNRNMGANGTTIGKAILQAERNHLDRSNKDWHTTTAAVIIHFMHDKRDPKVFWVYPQPSSAIWVQLMYAAHPTALTTDADLIDVDDLYENALHNWVVGYAYAKNSKRGDLNKANAYFTMFANAIGAKTQVQMAFAPISADADTNPAREPT